MDIQYMIQFLLLLLFFIGISYISSCYKRNTFHLFQTSLKANYSFTYQNFTKRIERKNLCAYDKYEIWRFIEKTKIYFSVLIYT